MLKVLLSPLSYLRIRDERKRWVDWFYPAALSLLSTSLVFAFGADGAVSGKDGLVDRLLLVSSVLPGFYIAALAAIATFNKPDIDQLMPKPTPTLKVVMRGKKNTIELTRRRFLSLLFAFLCFESLAILVACVFANLAGPKCVELLASAGPYATIVFVALLLLAFWQMLCTTCFGLYYLGDRLHHPTL